MKPSASREGTGPSSRTVPGVGEALDPRRQVGGLADRGVVHVEVAPDGADDDLAGIQPDPNLNVNAVGCGAPHPRNA